MNLEPTGNVAKAETAYGRVIALDPGKLLSERAETAKNWISGRKLRHSGDGLRPDVVAFCREALGMFAAMSAEEVRRITMEIAMLVTKGLSVSDPSARYALPPTSPAPAPQSHHGSPINDRRFRLIDGALESSHRAAQAHFNSQRSSTGNNQAGAIPPTSLPEAPDR